MATLIRLAADGTLLLIAGVGGVLLLMKVRQQFWATAPVVVMAGLTSLLVGKLMSLIYQPEVVRPFEKLGIEPGAAYINNPGFPSDHVLLATVIVCAVYAVGGVAYRRVAYLLASLVVIMGLARVAAHVHTPLDVVFGGIAGLSGTLWYKKLTK